MPKISQRQSNLPHAKVSRPASCSGDTTGAVASTFKKITVCELRRGVPSGVLVILRCLTIVPHAVVGTIVLVPTWLKLVGRLESAVRLKQVKSDGALCYGMESFRPMPSITFLLIDSRRLKSSKANRRLAGRRLVSGKMGICV